MRQKIGLISAALGFILVIYLVFGLLHLVPLVGHQILGETLIRFIGQCAIGFFLIAACCYWEI